MPTPTPTKAFVPQEEMVYVTIPEKDVLDHTHPGIGLNRDHYVGGKTYLVTKAVAEHITERLRVYEKSVIRLLRPQADIEAINDTNRMGSQALTATVSPAGQ